MEAARQDHHRVKRLTTAELERVKRDLQANLGLIADDSPAHVPILAYMRAVETELAVRANDHGADRITPLPW